MNNTTKPQQSAKPSGMGGKHGGSGGSGGSGESASLELTEGSELLVEEQGAVSKLIATDVSSLADMEVRCGAVRCGV